MTNAIWLLVPLFMVGCSAKAIDIPLTVTTCTAPAPDPEPMPKIRNTERLLIHDEAMTAARVHDKAALLECAERLRTVVGTLISAGKLASAR